MPSRSIKQVPFTRAGSMAVGVVVGCGSSYECCITTP